MHGKDNGNNQIENFTFKAKYVLFQHQSLTILSCLKTNN
jgi:hypothetical protein